MMMRVTKRIFTGAKFFSTSGLPQVVNIGSHEAYTKFINGQVNKKAMVYFTAQWCGPCKMIAPIYSQLSLDYPDIAFAKVDVDDLDTTAQAAGIRSMPTFQSHVQGEHQTALQFSGADQAKLEATVKALSAL